MGLKSNKSIIINVALVFLIGMAEFQFSDTNRLGRFVAYYFNIDLLLGIFSSQRSLFLFVKIRSESSLDITSWLGNLAAQFLID